MAAAKRNSSATPNTPMNSDRISLLPQPILHEILSSLETKDVIRTSVLSHRFYSAFLSFPILDLDGSLSHDSSDIRVGRVNHQIELAQDFFDSVHRTIERRQGLQTDLQKLRLRVPVSKAGQHLNRVKELINFALTKKVRDLEVDLLGFTDEYLISLIGPPSDGHFESVETLRLSNLRLNDAEDVMRFSGLKDLIMQKCSSFAHLKLSSSQIRSIKLIECPQLNRIEIKSPSLQEFVYEAIKKFKGMTNPCAIDISECKLLQFLSISNVSSNWVDDIVPALFYLRKLIVRQCIEFSTFGISNKTLRILELVKCIPLREIEIHRRQLPSLETLKLGWCRDLEAVKIEHDGVSSLEVTRCRSLRMLHVDTPQLVTFVYKGPTCRISMFNSRAILDAKLSIELPDDNSYFSELRDMVGHFNHVAVLTLACTFSKDLIFPDEIRWERGPTLCDLKHLKVQCGNWPEISTDLVDSLIWLSPHLGTLSFVTDECKDKTVKFQHNWAIGEYEEDPSCCYENIVKCWRHSVKTVELKNFNQIEADNLENYFRKNAKLAITVAREVD